MNIDLENDPILLLHDLARQMRTRGDQEARKYGMTRAQWIVLARLQRQPGVSQNELAAAAEVAPITIGRLIDRLEEQGLVERCPDPLDRRIWRLRLTPKAEPHLRHIEHYRREARRLMTKNIDPGALEAFMQTLHAMKRNFS
jgi:DNA-binding MarR family transcriptional regulator